MTMSTRYSVSILQKYDYYLTYHTFTIQGIRVSILQKYDYYACPKLQCAQPLLVSILQKYDYYYTGYTNEADYTAFQFYKSTIITRVLR